MFDNALVYDVILRSFKREGHSDVEIRKKEVNSLITANNIFIPSKWERIGKYHEINLRHYLLYHPY